MTTTTTDTPDNVLISSSKTAPGLGVVKPRRAPELQKERIYLANRDRANINTARIFYADLLGRTPTTTLVVRRALEVLCNHLETTAAAQPDAEGVALMRARNAT